MKDKIKNHMELMATTAQSKTGVVFFLVGLIPAKIKWEDETTEEIMLAERVRVKPFSELKSLLSKKEKPSEFMKDRMRLEIEELAVKMEKNIKARMETKEIGGKKFVELITLIDDDVPVC